MSDGFSFELGAGVPCNLDALVDTRALVQANSGGGKSHTIRRLLEQTFGKVQHLVIDPEGEFSSLREKFDYVLAAPRGGDTVAEPRFAKLLATRLLELNASAILDIYELKAHDRIRFVRYFLEALVDAPKSLWHPALVIIDEAHVYCPQKGDAESSGAVIDLSTRGRKRGFCAVLATQRLSKLHKDAAAECNNKLIGRTGLDVDMKRAAEELGFSGRDDTLALRDLEPGEFFCFGPALTRSVAKVRVGGVETEHPKAGARLAFTAPPPSNRVRALLPKLADLPAEAEAERKSLEDVKKENADLKRQLTSAKKNGAAPDETVIERRVAAATVVLERAHAVNLREASSQGDKLAKAINAAVPFLDESVVALREIKEVMVMNGEEMSPMEALVELRVKLDEAVADAVTAEKVKQRKLEKAIETAATSIEKAGRQLRTSLNGSAPARQMSPPVSREMSSPHRVEREARRARAMSDEMSGDLSRAQQRILDTLASLEAIGVEQPDKSVVAVFAGVSPTSGGYFNNLGRLRSISLIDYPKSGAVALTDEGRAQASAPDAPASLSELHERWLAQVSQAQASILSTLIEIYPSDIEKNELAEQIGVSPTSGGYFNNLGRLRTLGAVDYPATGRVAATALLFPEGLS